jgi:hypothetical protein
MSITCCKSKPPIFTLAYGILPQNHNLYRIPPVSLHTVIIPLNADRVKVPEHWPATVYERVQRIPIFQDPPCGGEPDIKYTFIRERFSDVFGTSPQGLEHKWPRTNGRREKNLLPDVGSTLLISANTDFNPYVPRSPCAAGLIFRLPGLTTKFGNHLSADGQSVTPETNTVLVRLDTNQYLYVGEYRVTHAGSLTLSEWQSLPDQQTWIKFARGRPKECNVDVLLTEGGLVRSHNMP